MFQTVNVIVNKQVHQDVSITSNHVAVKSNGATRVSIPAPQHTGTTHLQPAVSNPASLQGGHSWGKGSAGSAGSSLPRAPHAPSLVSRYKQSRLRLSRSTSSPTRSMARDGVDVATHLSNTTANPAPQRTLQRAAQPSMNPYPAISQPQPPRVPSKDMREITKSLELDSSKVLLALQQSLKVAANGPPPSLMAIFKYCIFELLLIYIYI